MPIYEYECVECGQHFDKFVRSISAAVNVECPECHSKNCRKGFSLFGMGSSTTGARQVSCAPSGT